MANKGFSLLETLVATVILTIVAVTLLKAHSISVLAEQMSRDLDGISIAARSATTDFELGLLSPNSSTNYGEWTVTLDPQSQTLAAAKPEGWHCLEISSVNGKHGRVFYLRDNTGGAGGPGQVR